MNIRTWDCDYPQDLGFELPPQEAVEINKEAYRMVSKEQPDIDDSLRILDRKITYITEKE